MFRFDKEQVVFDFAGVKMGGQPGEYPTVLAGTIFYGGHNIISDELTGDFDKSRAETLVNDMVEMSDVTGNPCIVQVFGQTEEAIVKYLEFVGDNYELPFLIDSTSGDARVAGARYADEVGLTQRAIYNSINMSAEKGIPYLNAAEAFKDDTGALPADKTPDGIHLTAAACKEWRMYIKTHVMQ